MNSRISDHPAEYTPSRTDRLNDVLADLNHVAKFGATKAERKQLRGRLVDLLVEATEDEFGAGYRMGQRAGRREVTR